MSEVYANGMNIACKAAAGKTVAAMPDVCLSPPSPPAGPVPIPYPNTGMASDTTDGTKTVMIEGQEVMMKNSSSFKQSSGDEAATKSFGMGVVTHTIQGKVNFCAWSMDVKFEGANVPRHLDLTGHNEMSDPPNTPTWPYLDTAAFDGKGPCKDVAKDVDTHCSKHAKANSSSAGAVRRKPAIEAMCADKKCSKALKCVLSPKSPSNCCPQPQPSPPTTTPHHIVPASQFKHPGDGGAIISKYSYNKAPCACVEGVSHSVGDHGKVHRKTNMATRKAMKIASGKQIPATKRWPLSQAEGVGAQAVQDVTGCPKACTESQVRNGHDQMKIKPNAQVRPTTAGGEEADEGVGFP